VFTPFHKPPYTYPYGRSVDETTTIKIIKGMSKSELAYLTAKLCRSITSIREKSKFEIASSSGKDDVRRLQHDMPNKCYA
jgi:hypothetical protein